MFAREGEIETTGALVKVDDAWTFQLELDNGTIIRCEQSWPTQAEANTMLKAWVEHVGGRSNAVQ